MMIIISILLVAATAAIVVYIINRRNRTANGFFDQPLKIKKYGTRIKQENRRYRKEQGLKGLLGPVVTICMTLIDLSFMITLYDMVQTENPLTNILCATALAAALDVPLYFAGSALRDYLQGIDNIKNALIVSGASLLCFLIAFVAQFNFAYVARDLLFSTNGASTLVSNIQTGADTAVQSADHSEVVEVAARLKGWLPLCTSLISFVIGFVSTDGLSRKIHIIRLARIHYEDYIAELEQALAETQGRIPYFDFMFARENDALAQFESETRAQGLVRKNTARLAIAKSFGGNSEEGSEIPISGALVNRRGALPTPGQNLSSVIGENLGPAAIPSHSPMSAENLSASIPGNPLSDGEVNADGSVILLGTP